MGKVDDGGPAFPVMVAREQVSSHDHYVVVREPEGGMSMRDYFAAKALSVVMQSSDIQDVLSWDAWTSKVAKVAYEVADAMLKERIKV